MTSRRRVCATIDEADVFFQKCWTTLADMKRGRFGEAWRDGFADFQEDLGRALFKLDYLYRGLASEKEATISRKSRLPSNRFAARMKTLDRYQEAIRDAIRIGKALGDAFAWFFYQRDQRYIEKHLQQPSNLHTPPGIGGVAELEFIKRFKYIDNHVAIYHGTTNFLRIGDVSFIHLPSMMLSAIGELKAKMVDDKTIETTLTLVSDVDFPNRMPSLRPARFSKEKRVPMPPSLEERFQRQLKRMNDLLDVKDVTGNIQARGLENIAALSLLLAELSMSTLKHKRIDDGLIISGVRGSRRGTKLSSRLLPLRHRDHSSLLDPVTGMAMEIVDKSTNQNTLITSRIHTRYVPGTTPIFWAPIPPSRLKQLLFFESMVWTWFNPLHLVRKLRARGFEVETSRLGVPTRLTKRIGSRTATIQNVDQFIVLITQRFFTEDAFVSLFDQMLATMKDAKIPPNVGVYMPLTQFYGEPPPVPEARVRRSFGPPSAQPKEPRRTRRRSAGRRSS